MYLKISAMNEFFNPKEGLKTLLCAPPRLAPRRGVYFFVTEVSSVSYIILVDAGSRETTKILRMVHALEILAGQFCC